jgi:type I restriction enzyme R subunit
MSGFTESVVEQAALAWIESADWKVLSSAEIAPGEPAAERDDYGQVVLPQRLRDALARLNPPLPADALEDAFRKLPRPEGADLMVRNRALHRLLVGGVTVEYRDAGGRIRGARRWPIASAIRRTRSGSCSCATCGSPASMRRACTPCTSTSRCADTG